MPVLSGTRILQGNIDQLEKVQRRAARFVLSDYDYKSSVTEVITKLGWDSLQVRRQAYRLAIFYKIHYGLVALGAAQLGVQRQQRASTTHALACVRGTSFTDNLPYVLLCARNNMKLEKFTRRHRKSPYNRPF